MVFFRTTKVLHDAAAAGNMPVLQDYLANSPEEWCALRDKAAGETALHKAAAHGRIEAVELLLKKSPGAMKAWTNHNGETALSLAIDNRYAAVVRLLLTDPAIATSAAVTAGLKTAIAQDLTDVLQDLVATGKADLTADNPPALYHAVASKRPNCVTLLLRLGANPNVTHKAPDRGGGENAYLAFRRRRQDTRPESPLFRAVCGGHELMVRELIAAGACVTTRELPLHAAAAEGSVRLAEELLAAPIVPLSGEVIGPPAPGQPVAAAAPNINAVNGDGQTALHLAVSLKKPEMVSYLVSRGANTAILDSLARTPLSIAQQFGLTDMVLLLGGKIPVTPAQKDPPAEPANVPQTAVAAASPAPQPAPLPVKTAPAPEENSGDSWTREGYNRVVHIENYPAQNRRLTEIFNFETRERTVLSENLSLKTETMGPRESFDAVTEEALAKALSEFRRLGGTAEESQVFRNRIGKLKAGPDR